MRRLIERWITEKKHVLVYGEAATGKTHLAYEFFLLARRYGLDPLVIASEPGTRAFMDYVGAEHVPVLTLDSLAVEVTRAVLARRYVIVDSINWHYRENPSVQAASIMAYAASLLYQAGGFSTAQVAGDGDLPSGAPYILPYAHVVASTFRGRNGFTLSVLKPLRRIGLFRVGRRGVVEWI